MKSVLISIKPKYCELISNGKKTVEVRKTKPKIDVPFKVYIYATQPKKWFRFSSFGYASDESLWLSNGKVKMCDGFEFWADETEYCCLNGKVIGEFVCNYIYENISYDCEQSCVCVSELIEYANGKPLYGWHITDLIIYDKPRELGEFTLARHCFNTKNLETVKNCMGDYVTKYYNNSFCRQCKYYDSDCNWCDKTDTERPVTRPPQSWCYVEELGV